MVFYNILSMHHPFCPRKSSKRTSLFLYLYTNYVSCTRLKIYFFAFNKSNVPGFSPNFRFRKPVLKFAFNHNTTLMSIQTYCTVSSTPLLHKPVCDGAPRPNKLLTRGDDSGWEKYFYKSGSYNYFIVYIKNYSWGVLQNDDVNIKQYENIYGHPKKPTGSSA